MQQKKRTELAALPQRYKVYTTSNPPKAFFVVQQSELHGQQDIDYGGPDYSAERDFRMGTQNPNKKNVIML